MTTTADRLRRALQASADELATDPTPEGQRAAAAARQAAAGTDVDRMRWVLMHPWRAAPR